MKLLTIENAKTSKGTALGYMTGILYLAPSTLSGVNLCPFSSKGCKAACLNTAGRGRFDSIQESRLIKTLHYLNNRQGFIEQLRQDIKALERKAKREGLVPCVRLNGTSDIRWEKIAPKLFQEFSHIQFYDYTKFPYDTRPTESLPKNYHLTYSRSEESSSVQVQYELARGRNVAVVVKNRRYDSVVTDGDSHDLRFLNKGTKGTGTIIELKAKGKAKKDTSGFVINTSKEV